MSRAPSKTPAMSRRPRLASALMASVLALAVAGCVSTPAPPPAPTFQRAAMVVPEYTGTERFIWCVPYARFVSGINIRGDAWTWWDQAEGTYARNQTPALGAVLSLKRSDRLSLGHIGVVTGIESKRKILISHANWGWNRATRGRVYENMQAMDVSQNNDWSEIRFLHPEVGSFGRVYKAQGFIHGPESPHTLLADRKASKTPPIKTGVFEPSTLF